MLIPDTNYQNALDYLYSFVDHSLTRQLRYSPEKFDLKRMERFMLLLGEPHKRFPVVHIAGTKGKGSTAAMIASILQESGHRVGLYTSPHLQDFCERIQINRRPLSHDKLDEYVELLKEAVNQVPEITTFELTTAIAFMAFADEKIDVGVIEVGLGGRLDATNVVDPLVSVITSISYDHMDILGNTISLIATEKAGIIKPGKPVVVAPQEKAAYEVIKAISDKQQAKLYLVDKRTIVESISHDLTGQSFQISFIDTSNELDHKKPVDFNNPAEEYWIPLMGSHQLENAATALTTITFLKSSGFIITEEAIKKGFYNLAWPGRFEILQQRPMIIVDAAHNSNSAMRLASTVRDYLDGKDITMIFGASEDKDVKGMFQSLLPISRNLIVTQSTHPRAMDVDILVELADDFGVKAISALTVEDALAIAQNEVGMDVAILVTGSIFIVAAVRELLMKSKE